LKANWLFGLNGIKREALDGRTSCASRLSASSRIIKISASIATTLDQNGRTATLPAYTWFSETL
jgi:hypothetical protein